MMKGRDNARAWLRGLYVHCKSGVIGERERKRERRMYKRKLESWPRGMTKRMSGVRERKRWRERKRERERVGRGERERREKGSI